ncbi:MAG: type II toxin-antitoxin system Phd/YefM family antitoxin [Deltaproteobacteria bacterium]|nr:type II toxin-antitoxin system Phd/YefM family antitoxin [Deltaproteobacteria bacterium]
MKLSQSIKPISYFKAHASEVIREISENQGTLVITQGGEAKVVIQDIHLYEQTLETLALLRMLAQSQESVKRGKVRPAKAVFASLRKKLKASQPQ